MNETIELQLLALAGCAVHYLKDWIAHNAQGKKYGWQKAVPTALLSVITSALLVYLRADISQLYVITPFSAVVLGYFGNSIFFSFVTAKKPKDADTTFSEKTGAPIEKTEGELDDGSKPGEEGRPDKP